MTGKSLPDLPSIDNESIRDFMIRYRKHYSGNIPDKRTMAAAYPNYYEISIAGTNQYDQAIEWVNNNIPFYDWYAVNVYFFFTNENQAAIFKLLYG